MIHATLVCLVLSVLCLSTRQLLFASGHEVTNTRVLRGHDDGQCPLMEERERVRNEIHQLTDLVVANFHMYSCGGTPGWRRVAFYQHDGHQLQLPHWTQIDILFQENMWTITHNLLWMFFNYIQC